MLNFLLQVKDEASIIILLLWLLCIACPLFSSYLIVELHLIMVVHTLNSCPRRIEPLDDLGRRIKAEAL